MKPMKPTNSRPTGKTRPLRTPKRTPRRAASPPGLETSHDEITQLALAYERMRLATESSGIGVWDLDLVTDALVWDAQMFALYQLHPSTFGGTREAWRQRIHSDDRARIAEEVNQSLRGEKRFDTDFRIVWPDGTIRLLKSIGTVSRDAEGSPVRMVGLSFDITEHRQEEGALREKDRIYRQMFTDQSAVRLLIDPATGQIVDANPAASTFYGYDLPALLTMNISEINTLPMQRISREMHSASEGKGYFRFKHRLSSGEERDVEVYATPINIGGRQLLNSIVHDVTERKKAEEALRRLNEELELRVQERTRELERSTAELRSLSAFNEQVVRSSPVGKLVFHAESGSCVLANEAAVSILGTDKDELLRRNLYTSESWQTAGLPQLARAARFADAERRQQLHIRTESRHDRWIDARFSCYLWQDQAHLLLCIEDITQRRRSEESLAHSEEQFAKAFRATPNAVSIVNTATGEFVDVNDEFLNVTGFSSQEVIGRTALSLNLWPDPKDRDHMLALMANSGGVREFDARLRTKDGTVRDFVVNCETVTIGGNSCLLFVSQDVSARKKIDKDTLKNEQRLKSLVKLLQTRAEDVHEFLDTALTEAIAITESAIGYIYHYSEEQKEFILNSWSKTVMKECAVAEPQTVYQLDKTGIWGEVVRQRKAIVVNDFHAHNPLKKGYPEGHVALERFLTIPLFVEEQIVAVVGVANKAADYDQTDIMQLQLLMSSVWGKVQSITAERVLKAQAKELARREEQYRLLFENMTSGFALHEMMYDEGGAPYDYRYLEINPAFEKLTGMQADALLGKTVREIMPNTEEYWIQTYGHVARTGQPIRYLNFAKELGKYYDAVAFSPRSNQFAVIFSDVTQERVAQAERERLMVELEKKNQELVRSNEELDDFAYIASHDLQEPLRMVSSYTQLLAKRYKAQLDGDANDFINFAVEGATRMQTLIKSLLSYSRVTRDGSPLQPVDCNAVLHEATQNLAFAFEESAAEITNDHLPTISANKTQLVQLFQNLIGNGVKFRGSQPPRIHVGVQRSESVWQFSIQDNGIGIDPEYFERIFVVFQRLHHRDQYDGTGIGLSVCRKIVERHGGRIWVTSTPGEGSTFHFTLQEGERPQ